MTIASEIERLQWAKSCIKASIEGKWVTVGSDLTIDQYPACIDAIKTTDYSCWTVAYWLKATTSLIWTRNWWLQNSYSEIWEDWTVQAIFMNAWRSVSSACADKNIYYLDKEVWCNPKWNSSTIHISEQREADWVWIYAHCTNPDCFLINREYCYTSSGSWSNYSDTRYYYRVWVNFDSKCMSCTGSWSWRISMWSCWDYDCDNNNPWGDYKYIGRSFSCLANCRWNKPTWILCTTLESTTDNAYVGAAVFR